MPSFSHFLQFINLPKLKKNVVILLLFFINFYGFSQNEKRIDDIYKNAKQQFDKNNFYEVSQMLKPIVNESTQNQKILSLAADAYRLDNDYENALPLYKNQVSNFNCDECKFWAAICAKNTGKYAEASDFFKSFLQTQNILDSVYILKSKFEILVCDSLAQKEIIPTSENIIHLNKNINSIFSELGAYPIKDSILYLTSYLPDNEDTTQYRSKIFKSTKKQGKWQDKQELGEILNDPNFDVANICFSPDLKTIFFNKCEKNGQKKYCKIYTSIWINNQWKTPEVLPTNINPPYSNNTQPQYVVTKTDSFLLFSSDRPKGYGGMDIWYSKIKNANEYTKPINAGKEINSIENEITPYYSSIDSTLYFSSTWFGSMGGYDIFQSKGDFVVWSKPESVQYPINTIADDYYFSLGEDKKQAIFTSNRKGVFSIKNPNCCNDIFVYPIAKKVKIIPPPDTVSIVINDSIPKSKSFAINDHVFVYFDNDEPDPKSLKNCTEKNYKDLYDKYLAKKDTYLIKYAKGIPDSTREVAKQQIDELFTMNIEFGYLQMNEMLEEIDRLITAGKKVEINLIGTASPLHSNFYNRILSKRRICSILNYIDSFKDNLLVQYTLLVQSPLSIEIHPMGEEKSAKNVSDKLKDSRNSIYSPASALERRVEIWVEVKD